MTHRIGIYPGTFDPVHPGHVAFAMQTLETCNLEEVVFLPEHTPRSKQGVTDIARRMALIADVTADAPGLRVVRLASKQFTVTETLPELRELLGDASLTLLVGSDVLRSLARWNEVGKLLSGVSLAVGMRSGDLSDEATAVVGELEKLHATAIAHTFIYTDYADITSSQIRNGTIRLAQLPPTTLTYLQESSVD